MKHSSFSPSSAERWMQCPGSWFVPKDKTQSPYALEGSFAHVLASQVLNAENSAYDYLGFVLTLPDQEKRVHHAWTVDEEMARYVHEYVEYVKRLYTRKKIMLIEQFVSMDHFLPNGYGTLDCAIIDLEERHAHVIDLKYGKGVAVNAKLNHQLMLYACGIKHLFKNLKSFTLHVVQPRLETASQWDVSSTMIRKFQKQATDVGGAILSGSKIRIPGEVQCRWCPDKADCPALSKMTKALVIQQMGMSETHDPACSNEETKLQILENKDLILAHIQAVVDDVTAHLKAGGKFPGWKLVHSRGTTRWSEDAESKLSSKLGDRLYKPKMLTITEVKKEKLLNKNELEMYTFKVKGNPVLAREDDKREEVVTKTELIEMFKE